MARGFIAAAVVLGAIGLAAQSASAYDKYYDCGTLAANTWCLANETHTYDYNIATYGGGFSIDLCEKLIAPNSAPEYQYSRRCVHAQSVTGYSDDNGRAPFLNGNTYMWALVANGDNGGASHLVRGHGIA
jgi:hypothetical protein